MSVSHSQTQQPTLPARHSFRRHGRLFSVSSFGCFGRTLHCWIMMQCCYLGALDPILCCHRITCRSDGFTDLEAVVERVVAAAQGSAVAASLAAGGGALNPTMATSMPAASSTNLLSNIDCAAQTVVGMSSITPLSPHSLTPHVLGLPRRLDRSEASLAPCAPALRRNHVAMSGISDSLCYRAPTCAFGCRLMLYHPLWKVVPE